MTRKVFFSFHFERDVWRASQVRNSGMTQDKAGFLDAASWEEVKKKGEVGIKNWIDNQLDGTSVTVVLIGAETNTRHYVKYELEQSWKKGNGILGIHIYQLKNQDGETDTRGKINFGIKFDGKWFADRFPIYDWVDSDGYNNVDSWIETAASRAGN